MSMFMLNLTCHAVELTAFVSGCVLEQVFVRTCFCLCHCSRAMRCSACLLAIDATDTNQECLREPACRCIREHCAAVCRLCDMSGTLARRPYEAATDTPRVRTDTCSSRCSFAYNEWPARGGVVAASIRCSMRPASHRIDGT